MKRFHGLGLFAFTLLISGMMQASAQDGAGQATVQGVGFTWAPGQSRMEIAFDKEVSFEQTASEADRQVVIAVPGAKISKKWARTIDTSQHRSNIALISPLQSGSEVKVVLQLKDAGGVEVVQEGKKIVALIANGAEEGAGAGLPEPSSSDLSADASTSGDAPATDAAEKSVVPAASAAELPTGQGDTIDVFMNAQKSKTYVGKRISLQVREAELTSVFEIISEASEFNIVVAEEVKGKIMLNLHEVPWDQALDLILHSNRLAAERQGNVLRVTTLEALTKEKEAEAIAKKASESAEPIVVKIFPISYAKVEDLRKILEDFLSTDSKSLRRGSIQIENRTNSLVVRDTPSNLEKIKRIVAELDTQTPQILIEAKFVEVNEGSQKAIGGRIFASSRELQGGVLNFNPNNNNVGAFFGGTGDHTGGFSTFLPGTFSITAPPPGASFGFAPKFGILPGLGEIGAFLSVLESQSNAKVIASPRVVTQNKEKAEIQQGQTVVITVPGGAGGSGTISTIPLTLKLDVTPQVTNDGSISLNVKFEQTALADRIEGTTIATNTKQVNTIVLVDSGATLVIGGVYSSSQNKTEVGIPFLRNLPIIGALFGSKSDIISKSELFIFLTPRILNEKESGLRG